jgi:DNA-binding CsgD family transcriptional regulator
MPVRADPWPPVGPGGFASSGHSAAGGGPGPGGRRRSSLSPGERQVLRMSCQGLSAKEIARILTLSAGTVQNRRSIIYQKLGVGGLAEACLKLGAGEA